MRRTAARAGAAVMYSGADPAQAPAVGAGAEAVPGPGPTQAPPAAPAQAAPQQQYELRTEFPFQLPRGYVDEAGTVHRDGVMRLSTARDELVPLRDVRVQENPAFLSVVLLGRVITRLGTLPTVHDGTVENMFASDLAFLQDFYRQINAEGHTRAAVECPHCAEPFEVELGGSRLGES
ncbi:MULTISPECIES: hypothetical protein [Streptomyces]|uniref:hypothetical protein n=1 Tax=Streptomyces TaxID=1883 RepID=UPI00287FE92C|nr:MULTISPECIES: hypothetical protein [Streptomyces]WNF65351.1 hypothetical protein RJD14_23420 [Streptomyces sp. CGMCC 4.1456]